MKLFSLYLTSFSKRKIGKSLRFLLKKVWFIVLIFPGTSIHAQQKDTLKNQRFSVHAQETVIMQYKPAFHADYSGRNSLITKEETQYSITSTLFLGSRLWQGASFFMNPEIAAGSGLSGSSGVGASTNGESYRVASTAPSFELARFFFRQILPLNSGKEYQYADANKLGGYMPTSYMAFTIGQISISDYFDNNQYSHDPRTQFMSWALMSNGAWDYPANTRGYTPSLVLEYVTPQNELRYGFSLVPTMANGMNMNWKIKEAGSHTFEYTRKYSITRRKGTLRFITFYTTANMGNYSQSMAINPSVPDVVQTEKNGRTKYGFGINAEQELNNYWGIFFRYSWNDGHNETWAFTEIDRSVSMGMVANGCKWGRENDKMGLAIVASGLSNMHRKYLQLGGKGFELGDGNLNYGLEQLAELYYSIELSKSLFLSGTYQFLVNPGYNKSRGPVNVFSLRFHLML